jgi:aminoglycoside 6'-N-acetyltransferase
MNKTTGPSLAFEWLEEAHADALYPGFSDPEVSRYTAERLPGSLEDMRLEFARFQAGPAPDSGEMWMNWAIRDGSSGELLGTLQATVFANGALWIGYKLVKAAWGRGIATAALRWLLQELAPHFAGRTVMAATDTRNIASQRVLEKCGFAQLRTEPAEIRGEATLDHIYQFLLPGINRRAEES